MRKGVSILVVDDEPIVRALLKDLLEEEGYEVMTAVDGIEGLERMEEAHFSIIFSDIHMPRMDGLEFLKKAKEIAPMAIIIMMDSFPDKFGEEAEKEGALRCIHKPFDIHEIRGLVDSIVRLL